MRCVSACNVGVVQVYIYGAVSQCERDVTKWNLPKEAAAGVLCYRQHRSPSLPCAQVYLIQQAGASYESFGGPKSCCGALCGEQEQAIVNMDASPLHALEDSIKYYSDPFARPSRIEVWQQHMLQIKCGSEQGQPI